MDEVPGVRLTLVMALGLTSVGVQRERESQHLSLVLFTVTTQKSW